MEDCYTVDFIRNAGLLGQLEDFISSKVTAALANLVSLRDAGRENHCPGPEAPVTPCASA